jgi:hypothetical protein
VFEIIAGVGVVVSGAVLAFYRKRRRDAVFDAAVRKALETALPDSKFGDFVTLVDSYLLVVTKVGLTKSEFRKVRNVFLDK